MENLTKEQWKCIAEKLSDYLERQCISQEQCDNCQLNFECEFRPNWITQAIEELGYGKSEI